MGACAFGVARCLDSDFVDGTFVKGIFILNYHRYILFLKLSLILRDMFDIVNWIIFNEFEKQKHFIIYQFLPLT